jgi:hypothetical protein
VFLVTRRNQPPAYLRLGNGKKIPLDSAMIALGRELWPQVKDDSLKPNHAQLRLDSYGHWMIQLDQGEHMTVDGRYARKNRLRPNVMVTLGRDKQAQFTFVDGRMDASNPKPGEVRS